MSIALMYISGPHEPVVPVVQGHFFALHFQLCPIKTTKTRQGCTLAFALSWPAWVGRSRAGRTSPGKWHVSLSPCSWRYTEVTENLEFQRMTQPEEHAKAQAGALGAVVPMHERHSETVRDIKLVRHPIFEGAPEHLVCGQP